MKTRVKTGLGIGVLVLGILAWAASAIPWGSANLATCRIVEAEQLANDSRNDERDPLVAPVPPPGELLACEVLFPDSKPFTVNPSLVVVDLAFYGGIGTAIYLRHRRRKSVAAGSLQRPSAGPS